MSRYSWLVVLMAGILLLPWSAFGDAQEINFRCILEYIASRFEYDWVHPGGMYWRIDYDDLTNEGGLGIPDVEEFKLLSLVLANPTAPNHDQIHGAFLTNSSLARTATGPTIVGLTTSSYATGLRARQPIPNTDPQAYYGYDGMLGAYITLGEWNLYMETMWMFKNGPFGAAVIVPSSDEGYVLLSDLSMCGDVDGDGAPNAYEYWAASPHSFANAIDPGMADAAAVWNLWVCDDAPDNTARFWYNSATQRVYFKPVLPLTWAEALDFTLDYAGRTPVAVRLCTIRNQQENNFIVGLTDGSFAWIGCTDAGRDIGHTAPNPEDWYWLSDPAQNPMTYTNWHTGEPDGVDGGADCGAIAGWWYDMSEFTGSPAEPRRLPAIFELPELYPDDDANGAPDAFEDKDGDLLPDGFRLPCPFAGTLSAQGAAFHEAVMGAESIEPGLKDDVVALGVSDWSEWDIEGIEDYPPDAPGDGLPDSAQAALIEYVACNEALDACSSVFAGMTTNKGLFESDVAALSATYPELATLATYKDLFAGLIGSSPEMKATVNAIILEMTGGGSGLPSLNEYVIFGSGGKGLPWFAGYGNFDGDDLTNAEEWAAVLAAGKGLDEFLLAATDPNNFWPGNPEIPVSGVIGAGLLAGTLLIAAAHALRRKQ